MSGEGVGFLCLSSRTSSHLSSTLIAFLSFEGTTVSLTNTIRSHKYIYTLKIDNIDSDKYEVISIAPIGRRIVKRAREEEEFDTLKNKRISSKCQSGHHILMPLLKIDRDDCF